MSSIFKRIFSKLTYTSWHLGFVNGGLDGVFCDDELDISWVKDPLAKKRWFADPFILDVTEDKIFLLVEEVRKTDPKGRITRLTINRHNLTIEKADPIIETSYHLSFPNILRKGEDIFIYPFADGSLIHLVDYDKLLGVNVTNFR